MILYLYLATGLGVYLGASTCRWHTFGKSSDILYVLKGFFTSLVIWPVVLILLYIVCKEERRLAKNET